METLLGGMRWWGQLLLCWEKKTASLFEDAQFQPLTEGCRLFPASFGKEARELALDFPPGRRQTYRAKGFLRNGGGWFLECQVEPSGGSQGTRSGLSHHLQILL